MKVVEKKKQGTVQLGSVPDGAPFRLHEDGGIVVANSYIADNIRRNFTYLADGSVGSAYTNAQVFLVYGAFVENYDTDDVPF